jgi:hypothetical protein
MARKERLALASLLTVLQEISNVQLLVTCGAGTVGTQVVKEAAEAQGRYLQRCDWLSLKQFEASKLPAGEVAIGELTRIPYCEYQ